MSNRTVLESRSPGLAQVSRPTEKAALRRTTETPKNVPGLPGLFAAVLDAQATGDRHGLSLAGHAIARIAGAATAPERSSF